MSHFEMASHSMNMAGSEYSLVGEKNGYLPLWLVFSAFSLGLFTLWSKESYIVPIFMGIGYLGVFVVLLRTVILSRDIFNPLCLIFLIGLVRYSCSAFLLLAGIEPSEEIALFYEVMGLSDSDWLWAHVLALTGLAGVAMGWLVVRGQSSKPSWLRFSFAPSLSHAALFGMVIGVAALAVFIAKNASFSAIVTGAMRSTEVQEGTGVFFRLIYMLIAGSILLSAYLLERNKTRLALVPVFICTLALLSLGGRGRALTPLLAGLFLRWYRNREQKGWPAISFEARHVFVAVPTLLLATWFFHFVVLYRGGYGLNALEQSLSLEGLWHYIQYAVFVEAGNLHSLAGAVALGPGLLEGQTFLGSLTFPLPKFLPIPGRSAGGYIVETLVGFDSERRWGLHAGLIGDAYLNFGLSGIMLIMPMFGMLMKLLYMKFRSGRLNSALYAFAIVYGVNLFLKSIEAWPHMLMGLIFMLVIIQLAKFFNFGHRALH
jgi:oligosaccharide repeat unit polymerase